MYCNRGTTLAHAGLFAAIRTTSSSTAKLEKIVMVKPVTKAHSMAGNVLGFVGTGGLAYVENCQVINGRVHGANNNNGTIIGATWPNGNSGYHTTVSNCCATGSLSGPYTGGLIGNGNYADLTNCYFSGNIVSTSQYYAGLIGCAESTRRGTIVNSYSNAPYGSSADAQRGTPKTATEMKDASFVTLLGNAYKSDCNLNDGFPVLAGIICGVPVEGETEICQGESTTLTATGWDSYVWSTGATTASITVSPSTTTDYVVTGTTGATSMTDTVTVTVGNAITFNAVSSPAGHASITPSTYTQPCNNQNNIPFSINTDNGWYITQIKANNASVMTFNPATDGYVTSHNYSLPVAGTNVWDITVNLDNKYKVTIQTVLNNVDETPINGSGLIVPWENNGLVTVLSGNTTFAFNNNTQYAVLEVFVDGISQGQISSFQLTNIAEDHTIKVVYSDNCIINTFPRSEGFATFATGTAAAFPCWTKNSSYSATYPYVVTSYPNEDANTIYFYTSGTAHTTLVSPLIDTALNVLSVKFYWRSGLVGATMTVGVMTDPTDINTFTPVHAVQATVANQYEEVFAYLNSYTGSGKYVAFQLTHTAYVSAYMDNITFDLAPTCIEPTQLSATNIGARTALFNWQGWEDNATYEVEITDGENNTVFNETGLPAGNLILSGLTPLTTYTAKVRTECEGGEYSIWDSITFTTILGNDCAAPNPLVISNITETNATLNWGEDGASLDYEVAYKKPADATWVNESVYGSTTHTLTNLSHSSIYNVRVRALCSSGNSAWKESTFNTACAPFTSLPIFEGFETYTGQTFPMCWGMYAPVITNKPYLVSETHTGTRAIDYHGVANGVKNVTIMPEIDIYGHTLSELQVDFWAKARNITGMFIVGVMDDPTDISTLTGVDTFNLAAAETWQRFIVPFNEYTGTGHYIAFVWENGNGQSALLDDIYIDLISGCNDAPQNMLISDIASYSATVSWTNPENSAWQIAYGLTGSTPDWNNATTVYDTFATVSGLLSNSNYMVFVRAACGTGNSSILSGTFTTLCGPVLEFPFVENFDSYATGSAAAINPCWKRVNNYSTTTYPYVSTGYKQSTPNSIYFYASGTTYNMLITPQLGPALDTLALTLSYRNVSNGQVLYIGVMTDPTNVNTFEPIDTIPLANNTAFVLAEDILLNSGASGNATYVAIKWAPTAYYSLYLDDIIIDYKPACLSPMTPVISNLTNTGATVSWTPKGEETAWEVAWGPVSTGPDWLNPISVTAATYSLSGLTATSGYAVAVRADCGGSYSNWKTISFTTPADEISGNGEWKGYVYQSSSTDIWQNRFTGGEYRGMVTEPAQFTRNTSSAWTGTTSAWVGTAPSENFAVRYKMTYNFPCGNYNITIPSVDDAARLSIDGGQTWLSNLCYGSIYCGSAGLWETTSYVNGTYTASVFLDGQTDLVLEFYEASGAASVGFQFAVAPLSITISNITGYSADVTIAGGNATSTYEYICGTSSSLVDTETPIQQIGNTFQVAASAPLTLHYLWVRTVCGENTSAWTPKTFTTTAACIPVPSITISNITTTTADVNWATLPNASGYTLEWGPVGSFTPGDGNAEGSANPTLPPYQITGLTPTSNYVVYIIADCGGGISSAPASANFTTKCAPLTPPYVQNFEGYTGTTYNTAGVVPMCWYSTTNNTTYPAPHITGSGTYHFPHAGTNALTFTCGGAGADAYAVLPAFATPIADLLLSFWYKMESATMGTLQVGYITGSQDDISTFVSLVNVPSTTSVTQFIYDFSTAIPDLTSATHIVLHWNYSASYYSCGVDDIEVWANTCPTPIAVAASNVTSQTADITWTAGGTETEWTVKYGLLGFDVNTGGTTVSVTDTFCQITGLNGGVSYDVYVQSNCSSTDNSLWVKTNFQTLCAAVTTFPFVENFDSYSTGTAAPFNPCWYRKNDVSTTAFYPYINENYYVSPSRAMCFYSTATTYNLLITPPLGASLDTMQVSFQYRTATAGQSLQIGVMTNPQDVSSFELVETLYLTQLNTYTLAEINLNSGVSGTASHVAIRWQPTGTYSVYIDDFVVQGQPSCPHPTALTVSAITENSATISWTAGGLETSWEVAYGPTGSNPDLLTSTTVTTSTYQMNGLSANTNYEVFVKAICGIDDESTWFSSTFATACGSITTLPFSEFFDTTPTGSASVTSMPNCWGYLSSNGLNAYVAATGAAYCHSSPNSLDFNWPGASQYALASMPPIATSIPINTLQVSFYGRTSNSGSGNFIVGVMSNPSNYSSFTPVDTIPKTTTVTQYVVDFANYTGNGNYIAFLWINGASNGYYLDDVIVDTSNVTPTTYTITATAGANGTISPAGTVTVSGGANQNFTFTPDANYQVRNITLDALLVADHVPSYLLQNIQANHTIHVDFEPIPTACNAPTGLTANNVTPNSATITWTAGGTETNWKVEWKLASASTWTAVTTTAATYALTGLAANTCYDVRVKALCTPGTDESVWSDIRNFCTPQMPCNDPTNLTQTGATASSITISWTPVNGETDWKVSWKDLNTGLKLSGTAYGNDYNNYSITSLLDTTQYEICVIAICAPGVESDSTNCFNATTRKSGIPTVTLANSLQLYPNPTTGELWIKNYELKEGDKIEIYNMLGQKQQLPTNNYPLTAINVSHLTAGVYTVKIGGYVGKFVKK
jgi:hypothetical protein